MPGGLVEIAIVVSSDIPYECHAMMRRSTFNQIRRLTERSEKPTQNSVWYGYLLHPIRIHLSEEARIPENTLFVLPSVKERYYAHFDSASHERIFPLSDFGGDGHR
jgi:hypothetical protein